MVYRGGGGAGSANNFAFGSGGIGGGGDVYVSGTANTGGGGGAGHRGNNGGNGGSGVVILKYPEEYTITIGPGLVAESPITVDGSRVSVITAGAGSVSWS
jgi:hypothetical protein